MFTNIAAGTLIVLGVLLTILGLLAAGSIAWVLVGLAAILAGGILGMFERRAAQ